MFDENGEPDMRVIPVVVEISDDDDVEISIGLGPLNIDSLPMVGNMLQDEQFIETIRTQVARHRQMIKAKEN